MATLEKTTAATVAPLGAYELRRARRHDEAVIQSEVHRLAAAHGASLGSERGRRGWPESRQGSPVVPPSAA
jgi:hypothetical protein